MFPIRDHNPSEQTPYVVYTLIAINVLVFLYGLGAHTSDRALLEFYERYAMVPAFLSDGYGYTGLFTHMFIHGGFMHILGNMLFLYIFGDNMEEAMGHGGFALFYVASGLGAAFAQYAAGPTALVPMVGASGAIAGVMGGYLLLFPKAKVDVLLILIIIFRIIPVPAWIMLGIWFAIQLFSGLGADVAAGGTAYWAHAGGFIVGLVLTVPVWLRRGGQTYWDRTEGHPPHPAASYRMSTTSVPTVRRRK
ncbi:rhomboid family intramembrane serine protease [Pelagovum pacificum]|uniref:Rhomboid family intramembrane serine protease n=1 Tax=Pelagovum pacificum TaxID=2588711 RepID=A0A5C5GGT3_9RHOB|nr:rhomboid family intramembrane serine protease [Pelagovum pacificum]QQA43618.1 rhomboid family intramembrane serine protease [Pelagovum pacificum]TNY33247.1 rhomboid family intramembrane serine protease [Pelagovum pacificum]